MPRPPYHLMTEERKEAERARSRAKWNSDSEYRQRHYEAKKLRRALARAGLVSKRKGPKPKYASQAERRQAGRLRVKYGLSLQDKAVLVAAQEGKCAICPAVLKLDLVVDHDHATGEVRGMLCDACNTGLGFFVDDPERLRRAAAYLEAPPATETMRLLR